MSIRKNLITEGAQSALIDDTAYNSSCFAPSLIVNDSSKGMKIFSQLQSELENICDEGGTFWFSVAFITYGGINPLLGTFDRLRKLGIRGKILTSNYLNFSEPRALDVLRKFENLEVKVYESNFHIKGYMFQGPKTSTFFIGSSNLTNQALSTNQEWNIRLTGYESGALLKSLDENFITLWNDATQITDEWLFNYYQIYKDRIKKRELHRQIDFDKKIFKPNKMQEEALTSLKDLRVNGAEKAILISATGTGKTILVAFDVKEYNPKRFLFLAHREQLLNQAEQSFKEILGCNIDTGILSGTKKNFDNKYLFSTMNMMAKESIQEYFSPDSFDYIVIDEAHRAAANSYKAILNYFKPKFLFGMTATPNRTDAKEVLSLFDFNIALRINLQRAMRENLLCPFHYFGISEIFINGQLLADDTNAIGHLSGDERVKNIIEKVEYYGYSGDRVKGLIFCSRVDEAKTLSSRFNDRGYRTQALSCEDSDTERFNAIVQLEEDDNLMPQLDYIFTVDVFNEGVDIPSVNQVVLLRSTESSLIFIQQLGRGLRKFYNKEFVVVIDFIGNYKKNYNIPIALYGDRTCNKEVIRKTITDGSRFIPGSSTIFFDEISKQQIFRSIDNGKIGNKTDIRDAYKTLRNEINKIPSFKEFQRSSRVEMSKVFEEFGSYYTLMRVCEKDSFPYLLSTNEFTALDYLSKRVGMGKDFNLISLLKYLVNDDDYPPINNIKLDTIYKILSHSFSTVAKTKKSLIKHEACILADKFDDKIVRSNTLKNYLNHPDFKMAIDEIIVFASDRYWSKYSKVYESSNMTLFESYSYCDVCELLNWNSDESATIGGYKFNKKTNTLPVFINYNKNDKAIDYNDIFLSEDTFQAHSKKQRKMGPGNSDWEHIYKAKENDTKIYLFVRKSKEIKSSKNFFFLGEVLPIGESKRENVDNKEAFKIIYKLQKPVRKDLYEYFTIAD
jgi:superfamily II DNA or RNA helicase/HKD family nuclease